MYSSSSLLLLSAIAWIAAVHAVVTTETKTQSSKPVQVKLLSTVEWNLGEAAPNKFSSKAHSELSRTSPIIKRSPSVNGVQNLTNDDDQEKGKQAMHAYCPDWNQCSFVERFDRWSDRWIAAHGFTNGGAFAAWWSKWLAVINFGERKLKLSVNNYPGYGKRYSAGELRSTKWHGYGCYEVRMKPDAQQGLISSFFTYTGYWDAAPGATKQHNEIDIEFMYRADLGKLAMQANYYTNGVGGNEKYIELPFRADERFHNYAFRWRPNMIEWFVDGIKVHTAYKNIPKSYNGNQKIMMNFWPVERYAWEWAGYFNFRGRRTIIYDAVRFTEGEHCGITNYF